MATIQPKTSRGHKYWYIVESRRVNGKPRPIVLEYLGKASDLLKRLQGLTEGIKLKSYSHGAVCALLKIANQLDVVPIINKYIKSERDYMADKPIRNGLTAGITLLLGGIGRVCNPTSKMGWWKWAKTTSCEYLLRHGLSKVDSQHFWDLMDSLPVEAIEKIETEIMRKVLESYEIKTDTLLIDRTNFFTFIDSTNDRCTIARRGKNKQKRNDLRQVGLAMVVTQKDFIPLFHSTYEGNLNDIVVFQKVIRKVKKRITDLGLEVENLTLVFDRGNNSKKNMDIVKELNLYYVGALTPYHNKDLVETPDDKYQKVRIGEKDIMVYRDKKEIWGEERTVIVFVSDTLKAGQLRGIYQLLEKKEKELEKLQLTLANPKTKHKNKDKLKSKIEKMLKGQHIKNIIDWSLKPNEKEHFQLEFSVNKQKLSELEDTLGFRILMTNRHEWDTADIIKAYHGQANIENAFKNMKNPYHLAITPEFHWTDQKIAIHFFSCVIGYLLATLIQHEVKSKAAFSGTLDNLLSTLNNIRLASLLEESFSRGRLKTSFKLEEMSNEEKSILKALEIENFHINRPKFKGVGVYN